MLRQVVAVLVVLCVVAASRAGSQLFPSRPDTGKVSAFLIRPTQGVGAIPQGWLVKQGQNFGNCAIGDDALAVTDVKAAPLTTRSDALPKSDYIVSVCVRGKGKARLVGSDKWVDINVTPANYFKWVELGTVKAAEHVAVEVAPADSATFFYGGVLAEGDALNINPVADVWRKIQRGGPVTVVLLGDSVTENFGGKGGGSSSFDKGNPGLMKSFLEQASGKPVDYIAHREPRNWPRIGSTRDRIRNEDPAAWPELDGIPTAEFGDKKHIDARQPLDAAKAVHLINCGKGGADATYSWSRMRDTIFDNDYRFNAKAMAAKGLAAETVRHGLAFYKPDLVIINFGTNDNNGAHPDWTVDDYLFYTRCAATNIQQRFGAAVILSTPHKWTDGTHLRHHWQPELVDRLRDYCKRSGLALADVYMQYPLADGDGIHPRDAGHAHLADAYIAAIKGIAPKPASAPTTTAADLKDNGDGTVTLTPAGLMMLADPNALGEVTSHEQAAEAIKKLNAQRKAGHDDWRMPTREELFKIIDQSRRPAVVAGAPFKGIAGFYYVQADRGAWGVNLTVGIAHTLGSRGHDKAGHVFPVRGVSP